MASFLLQGFLLHFTIVNAAFMVLSPADYRDDFVEGWPGPHGDGSGVGAVNQSTYEWAVENLPLFESSDEDLYVSGLNMCISVCFIWFLEYVC